MTIRWQTSVPLFILALLTSAGKCPVEVGNGSTAPAGETDQDPQNRLDVGGPQGALWQLDVDTSDATVTLRAGQQEASAQAEIRRGAVTLLGRQIWLCDFCWRTDVVCPHQLLPESTTIAQDPTRSQVLIGHSRKGPLAAVNSALIGVINAKEIDVPLGQASDPLAGQPCALLVGSTIIAALLVEPETSEAEPTTDGEDPLATRMEGRITLVYGGSCLTIGGSGVLEFDDRVGISMPFSAERAR